MQSQIFSNENAESSNKKHGHFYAENCNLLQEKVTLTLLMGNSTSIIQKIMTWKEILKANIM